MNQGLIGQKNSAATVTPAIQPIQFNLAVPMAQHLTTAGFTRNK